MTHKMSLLLSVVIGGLAIHGAITACGRVGLDAIDAHADSAWAAVDMSIPPGTIVAFGGTTIPAGWLLCDGSEVSRTIYAALFGATSISFGGGDGVTTFNLPDLRGRFLRGVDNGAGQDPNAGSRTRSKPSGSIGDAVGSFQSDATAAPRTPFVTENTGDHTHATGGYDRILRHTGTLTSMNTDSSDISGTEPDLVDSQQMATTGAHTHRLGGSFGSGGDDETRPKNVAVNYIVKL